jgi:hypothetical protein
MKHREEQHEIIKSYSKTKGLKKTKVFFSPLLLIYLFFFLSAIPLKISAPAASVAGTVVSIIPVGTFSLDIPGVASPEDAPGVVFDDAPGVASSADTEIVQERTAIIVMKIAKNFFIKCPPFSFCSFLSFYMALLPL